MPEDTQASIVNETVQDTDTDNDALDTQDTSQDNQENNVVNDTKSKLDYEAALKELEKTRRESAKYRTKLRELEEKSENERKVNERAKMEETERIKAEKADIEQQLQAREKEFKQLNTQIELQGKVVNPKAAVKLLEDNHYNADGDIDFDAFFADYPELKPQPTETRGGANVESAPTNPPDVSSGRNEKPRNKLTVAEVANMSVEQYRERRNEIFQAMREGGLNRS